jgi:hypothetical protein
MKTMQTSNHPCETSCKFAYRSGKQDAALYGKPFFAPKSPYSNDVMRAHYYLGWMRHTYRVMSRSQLRQVINTMLLSGE